MSKVKLTDQSKSARVRSVASSSTAGRTRNPFPTGASALDARCLVESGKENEHHRGFGDVDVARVLIFCCGPSPSNRADPITECVPDSLCLLNQGPESEQNAPISPKVPASCKGPSRSEVLD